MMIFPEDTAYAILLNAFAFFGPLFAGAASLLGALFAFTLFTFAVIAVATTFATFALAMITIVRCKRWINPFSSRDHRHDLQHRRRYTRTRAKACPKQCCYRPDATQPPATLGMWKWFNIITLWYYDIKYFRIFYLNHVCLMTCLVCLRGCKCICLGKTHISGMMSSYNMSAILKSVLYEPLSWKYIISRSPFSLLIELTFRGLRNFSAQWRHLKNK